jgi:hypothetical protein
MRIVWVGGNDIQIPDVGMPKQGEEFDAPDAVALSLIDRGLAKDVVPETTERTIEASEETP